MSPLEIRILLHHHYSPYDFEDYVNGGLSPASQRFIATFLANGCLQPALPCHGDTRQYVLGPRGQAFVDYICTLPLPREVWTMSPVTGSGPPPWRIAVPADFELSDYWKGATVAERAAEVRKQLDAAETFDRTRGHHDRRRTD